jgi:hypothetical protein
MSCIVEGPFNQTTMYGGIPGLNIVMIIISVTILAKYTKIPGWVLVIPVAFALYKLVCLNSVFFNQQKTGIVSSVSKQIIQ